MRAFDNPCFAQSRRLTLFGMQTRFYDSAEPGPPHGWLDADQGVPLKERPVWENAVTVIQQTARRLTDSLRGGDVSSQIWGSLRTGGCWWIYHVISAGEDRFGRPGRTFTVLFCSDNKGGFDWETICTWAPGMEALAKNRSHLDLLLRRIDRSQSSASLTDDLLKQPSSPLLEALKSEMGSLLDGLGEGSHEYFTITENGTVSNRGQENISPKPPSPRSAPKPNSETAAVAAPVKPAPSSKLPPMKIFTHVLCLVIGLLLGFVLHGVPDSKTSDKTEMPKVSTDQDAISHLRAVTDYLSQRSGPTSPGEPPPPRAQAIKVSEPKKLTP